MSNNSKPSSNHDPKRSAGNGSLTAPGGGLGSLLNGRDDDTSSKALWWMFRFLLPVKREALLAMTYLSVGIGFEILTTAWTRRSIDQIGKIHQQSDALTRLGFWHWFWSNDINAVTLRQVNATLMGIAAGLWVFRYLREVSAAKLSMRMVYYIREAVYDKVQRVGFGFHDQVTSGQLINRALTDLQNVRQFLQTSVITVLDIVLVVGGYIIYLGIRSPLLALLAVVPLPVWTWYILRFSKRVQPVSKRIMEADDRNVSLITENIAGVHVVKAFATEEEEKRKYNGNCDDFFGKVLGRIRMYADFTPVIRTIGILSNLSLVLAVALMVIVWGKLGVGDLVIIGIALNTILGRLQQVSAINEQYQLAVVSARRLLEVLKAEATVPEKSDAQPLPAGKGAVKFENVTFGYDPAKPVLKDITFEIPGGTNVAIVGPTGAGKTTLVSLIARYYDPQRGRILIDGMDVRDASLASIRTQTALVFQETYLFSDTVEANIAYGRPGVKGGEVEAAARLAQAHDFIENLAHGYQTLLGERGSSLSGGQKQRLAIARAILFNPRILVLDDATAAVDPETEDLIRRGMKAVLRDRTVFTIAHRISTVKRADLVIVIENGEITQMGTHKQLMAEDGHYREIAAVQLYGEEEHAARRAEKPSHMDRVQDERELAAVQSAAKTDGTQAVNSEEIR